MSIEDLFSGIKKEAFRLELLDSYLVEEEREQFRKFKKGEDIVDEETEQFCKIIRQFTSEGKRIIRTHVIPRKLTDYLKFEIKTGYIPQLNAGTQIYLIYREKYNHLLQSGFEPNDFWLFDNSVVVELIYDKERRFLNERIIENRETVKKYIAFKENIIKNATPLKEWLKTNWT